MNDRTLHLIIYATTPIMYLVGLGVLYLLVADHPWFPWMVLGYTLLLLILFSVKISIYRYLRRQQENALKKTQKKNGENS
jgi:O-antigen/teichoic acid export membrane protein